jgi:hypothetical protein
MYMEPLWDELISAWEEGVWTYDRAKRATFKMYVWYQYSIHNFLAYGLFSTWCVHGNFPCPMLTVKFRQPSHEFTSGVGMNFISYPLVLTPVV